MGNAITGSRPSLLSIAEVAPKNSVSPSPQAASSNMHRLVKGNDGAVVTPSSTTTADTVNKIRPEEQAEVAELLGTLHAALDSLSSKNASELNGRVQEPALHDNSPGSQTLPAAAPEAPGSILPAPDSAPAPANENPTPGKKKKMAEAIANAFSGRAGMIAGAVVFGLVAVSALALISAFPPVLLFVAVFGLAVAGEMRGPVREFQADLRNQRENEEFDHIWNRPDKPDEEEYKEADEPWQLPPAPPTPLPQSVATTQSPVRPAILARPQQQGHASGNDHPPVVAVPLRLPRPS
jgi:hypothetical protein